MPETVGGVARSPPTWLFAAAWLGSALVLALSGQGFPFFSLLNGAGYLLLSLLTVAITRPAAMSTSPPTRPRLWLQIGLLLPFVALTAWRGLAFHRIIGPEATIPLWSRLVATLEQLGARGSATTATSRTRSCKPSCRCRCCC